MDPKVLQALQAIAQRLAGTHPAEAQTLMQWVASGGQGMLPAAVLALALPIAPTLGIPATALMAALKAPIPSTQSTGNAINPQSTGSQVIQGPRPIGSQVEPVPAAGGVVRPVGPMVPGIRDNNSFGYPGVDPRTAPTLALQAGGAEKGMSQNAEGGATPATSTIGGVRDNNSPDYPGNAPATPTPGAPPGAPSGSGSSSIPGGFTAAQGSQLSTDDRQALRFAMQAAGFNPDVLTPATKIAMQALKPLILARRAAYGANSAGQNVGGLPQDIASFAKEFTTPGADFYGHARDYAQGILGGKTFEDFISGLADPMDQFNMYQALTPLLYGGSNPMIQQSVADQLQRQQNLYGDEDFNQQGKQGSILDFIRKNPNLSPSLRGIFGPQR